MRRAVDNPFRTRRIQGLSFRGADPVNLVEELKDRGRGALVGPHGTGKTTLLEAMGQELIEQGWTVDVTTFRLEGGHRKGAFPSSDEGGRRAVLIDGIELLAWPERRWLQWRLRGVHLVLVTSHHPTVYPTLRRHRADAEVARGLLRELVGDRPDLEPLLDRRLDAFRGNLRDVWLSLYDDWAAGRIL